MSSTIYLLFIYIYLYLYYFNDLGELRRGYVGGFWGKEITVDVMVP